MPRSTAGSGRGRKGPTGSTSGGTIQSLRFSSTEPMERRSLGTTGTPGSRTTLADTKTVEQWRIGGK